MTDGERFTKCFGQAVAQLRELRKISRETLAKTSKIKLELVIRIEEGQITGEEFGLREICFLAKGMNITPYRLMLKCEQLYEER